MKHAVSIVTVNLNNRDGLVRTVNSIAKQSHPPAEVIIVDGGSTDGSLASLDAVNLDNCTLIVGKDSGIYDAMNRGIQACGGHVVNFMNSGDTLADEFSLARVVASYSQSSWAWAVGKSQLLGPAGTIDAIHFPRRPRGLWFRGGFGSLPHQSTFFERRFLSRVGPFRPTVGFSADQEHMLRAWSLARPSFMPFVVARCEPAGVSSTRQPGDLPRLMAHHRRTNDLAYPLPLDKTVTALAVRADNRRFAASN